MSTSYQRPPQKDNPVTLARRHRGDALLVQKLCRARRELVAVEQTLSEQIRGRRPTPTRIAAYGHVSNAVDSARNAARLLAFYDPDGGICRCAGCEGSQ